jgi:hypothetical protein
MTLAEQFQDAARARHRAPRAGAPGGRRSLTPGRRRDARRQLRRSHHAIPRGASHPALAPADRDQSLDERIVTGKLNDALEQLDASHRAQADQRAAEAQAEQAHKEEELRNYRVTKLRTIFDQANQAFLADDYAKAEALVNQILLEDPGNTAAIALRDAAQAARHHKTEADTLKRYREQWNRTFDELDTMDVPQIDAIVFDDLHRWKQSQPAQAARVHRQGSRVLGRQAGRARSASNPCASHRTSRDPTAKACR